MSAIPPDEPAQEAPSAIDTQQLQQQLQQQQQEGTPPEPPRKPKAPSVRRACIACHTGKTRCSEVLPCQSCLKRGLGNSCAYPDPDAQEQQGHHSASAPAQNVQFAPPPMYATLQGTPNLSHQQYYDYNGSFTGASTSTFRPNKRPRALTEEETAAIRNFSRGDFFVGSSAPVRIDPRLPVRLTLGEGDHVHFTVGETLV
uniref:Zn(2)-C6 fungal-type domain-containing protein n=1 Tax=Psilocybe cubensis TaxID=181762 RepID=A0A8H7Y6V6_PSICU